MRKEVCKSLTIVFLAIGVYWATAVTCFSQSPSSNPKVSSLADLEFISGRWAGEMDGGITEEHWSSPRGDSMMWFKYKLAKWFAKT
jgi:Domain of unknown function (DUF6265)